MEYNSRPLNAHSYPEHEQDWKAEFMGNKAVSQKGAEATAQMYLLDSEPQVGDVIDGERVVEVLEVKDNQGRYDGFGLKATKYHATLLRKAIVRAAVAQE